MIIHNLLLLLSFFKLIENVMKNIEWFLQFLAKCMWKKLLKLKLNNLH